MSVHLEPSAWGCQQGFCGAGLAGPLGKLPFPGRQPVLSPKPGGLQQEQLKALQGPQNSFGFALLEIQISLIDLVLFLSVSLVSF